METKKQIQDAIDMLQTLQSDLSKNEGVSKERILAYLEAFLNDSNEERERNLHYLKEECERFVAGDVNEDYFFNQVMDCKRLKEDNMVRISILRYVIDEIRNNFKED